MSNNKIIVVINLKAKLRPLDRGDLEDAFLDFCENSNIKADIIGGGTLVEENGEIIECDIEVELPKCNKVITDKIIDFFETTLAPIGSSLTIEGDNDEETEKVTFGVHEGLGLYMNNMDLPAHYYADYDINYVYEECDRLVKDVGMIHSYWNGNEETALYMYGDSYEEMLKRIESFVKSYPLCEKSRTVKIA